MSNLFSVLPEHIQFNIFSYCDSKSLFYLIKTCRDIWRLATTNSALWKHQLYGIGWPRYLTQEIFFIDQQQERPINPKKQSNSKKKRKTNISNALFSSCCREFELFQRYENIHQHIINKGYPTFKKVKNRVFSAIWSEIADVACLARYCYPLKKLSLFNQLPQKHSFDIMITNGQLETQAYLNVDEKHAKKFQGINASFVDPSEGIMNGVYFKFEPEGVFRGGDKEKAFYWDLTTPQDDHDTHSSTEYDWEEYVTKFTAGRLCSVPFYYWSLKQPVVPFSHSLYGKVFFGFNPITIVNFNDLIGHKSFNSMRQDKKTQWQFNDSKDWNLTDIGESPSHPPFCAISIENNNSSASFGECLLVDLEQQKSIFRIEKQSYRSNITIPQLPQVSNLCMVGSGMDGYGIYDIRKSGANQHDAIGWIAGPQNKRNDQVWLDDRKAMFSNTRGYVAYCDLRMLNGAHTEVEPSSFFDYNDHEYFTHEVQFQWHSYSSKEGEDRATTYSSGL